MKIFQIVFDSDKYQYVFQKDRSIRMGAILLRGESRVAVWPDELEFEVPKHKWPRGVFLQWSAGEFVLTQEAQNDKIMVRLLEADGEFLPVVVDGEPRLLHNITRFADCTDQERSKWGPTIGNVPGRIEFPRFHPSKIPLGIHFRIREFPVPRYVATDPSLPPEKDFYQWYHKQGYKGLTFRLMWDSEKPDDLICFY